MQLIKLFMCSSIVVVLTLSAGCADHEAVKDMNDYAAKVCACKTVKCIVETSKEGLEINKKYEGAMVRESDNEKIAAAAEKIKNCRVEVTRQLHEK